MAEINNRHEPEAVKEGTALPERKATESSRFKFSWPSGWGSPGNNGGNRDNRNLRYKFLAVLLAVLLWFYAANERGLIHDRVFDNIPLGIRNLESGLLITEELPRVQITIRGSTEGLNATELTAYVDLTEVPAGETLLPVHVNLPAGVTLVNVKPNRVQVKLAAGLGKQFPVDLKLTGKTAVGWLTMTPTLKPSQVLISGGKDALEKVQSAAVSLDLRNTESSLTENLALKAYDRNGALVEGLQFSPAYVEVFVPVIREQPLKAVPVKAVLTGSPAAGFQVAGTSVEPDKVNLIGPAEILERFNEVQVPPLDISGIDQTLAHQVQLNLPDGLTGIEPAQVTLIVRVARLNKERDLGPIAVKLSGLASGLQAGLQPSEVTVRVAGPAEVIDKLNSSDLAAEVNLAGLSAGKHSVPVSVKLPKDITLVKVSPAELTVTLASPGAN